MTRSPKRKAKVPAKRAMEKVASVSGDAVYRAVSAIMVSPETLQEMADRTREREARRLGVPPRSERATKAAVKATIRHYGKLAGVSGGGTALTGIISGIGTAIAIVGGTATDLAVTLKLQAEMTLQIAHLYGTDISSEEKKHFAFLLTALGVTANAGQEAASKVASKALTRLTERHLRGATLAAAKRAFRAAGIVFTRKGLVKAIPFGVGAAVGYVTGAALTRTVGREVAAFYAVPTEPGQSDVILDVSDADLVDLVALEGVGSSSEEE